MKAYLRKIISCVVAVLISFSLFSCYSDQMDEGKIATDVEGVLSRLFNAVQLQDKEAFKAFFADDVIELPDFETGCDYVFDRYRGELVGVTFRGLGSTGKRIVPGEEICYAHMTFNVITSEAEYKAVVECYTQYESKYPNDPYKIKTFAVLDGQNNEDFDHGYGFSQRQGIFYPGWLDE